MWVKDDRFSLIQSRGLLQVRVAALSPSMDLLACISHGALVIFRTHSWEKAFQRNVSEMFEVPVSCIDFSTNGKYLALGADDGSVAVLDLESGTCHEARRPSKGGHEITTPVSCLSWLNAFRAAKAAEASHGDRGLWSALWFFGGAAAAERAGVSELTDVEQDESEAAASSSPSGLMSIFTALQGYALLVLNTSGELIGYAFGIYPIFCIDVFNDGIPPSHFVSSEWGIASDITGSQITLYTRQHRHYDESSGRMVYDTSVGVRRLDSKVLAHYTWLEHVSRLLMQMSTDLNRLSELLSECSRKWKEAAKPIPIKLGLVHSALQGYQLPYTPLTFYYTVAMCGAWHPVAQTSFTQHWNEQGISRLRVAIEGAAQTVSVNLKLKMIPIATNLLLRARELMGMVQVSRGARKESSLLNKNMLDASRLYRSIELLMYKLDDASTECEQAHRGLMLFLQFIRDFHNTCNTSPASPYPAPEPKIMETYIDLFDPRKVRAPATPAAAAAARAAGGLGGATDASETQTGGVPFPSPVRTAAEAEAVCATHLYAYFADDGRVPPSSSRSVDKYAVQNSDESISSAEAFYQGIRDIFQKADAVDASSFSAADEKGFEERSLSLQLKMTRKLFNVIEGLPSEVAEELLDPSKGLVVQNTNLFVGTSTLLSACDVLSLGKTTLRLVPEEDGESSEVQLEGCLMVAIASTSIERNSCEIVILCLANDNHAVYGARIAWSLSEYPRASKLALGRRLSSRPPETSYEEHDFCTDFVMLSGFMGSESTSPDAGDSAGMLFNIDVTNIGFWAIKTQDCRDGLPSYQDICASTTPIALSVARDAETTMDRRQLKAITNADILVASGQRGLVCVIDAQSHRLNLLDVAEHENGDDEEGDGEHEGDGHSDADSAMDT